MEIEIRKMSYEDIGLICEADGDMSSDLKEYLNNQLENQTKGDCCALVALYNGQVAGHVFLYYKCKWGGCKNQGFPSVVDLKVFNEYRQKGIGSQLMDVAENMAKAFAPKIYLDVCLNRDYGAAQRLYMKRGYVPDGNGIYYEEEICQIDGQYTNNDELTMCLIKDL